MVRPTVLIAVIEMPLSVESKEEKKKVIKRTSLLLEAKLASEALNAAKKHIAHPELFKVKPEWEWILGKDMADR